MRIIYPRLSPRPASTALPLIVRFAAFGDVVLLTTLIESLFCRFGQRVDLLGTGAWTTRLLAADLRIGHVQLITRRKSPYILRVSQWKAVRWLRSRGCGPVYHCDPELKSLWLLRRGGIDPVRIVRAHYAPVGGEAAHWTDWWVRCGALTPAAYAQDLPALGTTIDPVPRLFSFTDRKCCLRPLACSSETE